MSTRTRNRNTSTRNTTRRPSTSTRTRQVFDPSEYDGAYNSSRTLSRIGMSIRREDTRHGGESRVSIYRRSGRDRAGYRFDLTLAEARSLKTFLDRELKMRAR